MKVQYNLQEDQLILLGAYVDHSPHSHRSAPKGNHEDLMSKALTTNDVRS